MWYKQMRNLTKGFYMYMGALCDIFATFLFRKVIRERGKKKASFNGLFSNYVLFGGITDIFNFSRANKSPHWSKTVNPSQTDVF